MTRATLTVLGVLALLVGVVFFGQGINVIHGSSMSGSGGYAVLGAALVVVGVGLIVWAQRLRGKSKI